MKNHEINEIKKSKRKHFQKNRLYETATFELVENDLKMKTN